SLLGGGLLVLLPAADLLDEAQVRTHLLHHPVLERAAARHGLGARERRLRLLGLPGGEIGHAEVMERRRRRRPLARPARALARPVDLLTLGVPPAGGRERIGLELVRRRRERPTGIVERLVEVLAGLGEVRGELVIADGLRGLGRVLLEKVADETRGL